VGGYNYGKNDLDKFWALSLKKGDKKNFEVPLIRRGSLELRKAPKAVFLDLLGKYWGLSHRMGEVYNLKKFQCHPHGGGGVA
jgi:hypothetical protein